MQQANKLFILSRVPDHISGSLDSHQGKVRINLRHKGDTCLNRLQIIVAQEGKNFILQYDALYEGERIVQAKSDPVPADLVQHFIAQIAFDTIPR